MDTLIQVAVWGVLIAVATGCEGASEPTGTTRQGDSETGASGPLSSGGTANAPSGQTSGGGSEATGVGGKKSSGASQQDAGGRVTRPVDAGSENMMPGSAPNGGAPAMDAGVE
ncbi:MAG: hypothetical protein RJA70_3009, partial [Pseudomonadota bacterium]